MPNHQARNHSNIPHAPWRSTLMIFPLDHNPKRQNPADREIIECVSPKISPSPGASGSLPGAPESGRPTRRRAASRVGLRWLQTEVGVGGGGPFCGEPKGFSMGLGGLSYRVGDFNMEREVVCEQLLAQLLFLKELELNWGAAIHF